MRPRGISREIETPGFLVEFSACIPSKSMQLDHSFPRTGRSQRWPSDGQSVWTTRDDGVRTSGWFRYDVKLLRETYPIVSISDPVPPRFPNCALWFYRVDWTEKDRRMQRQYLLAFAPPWLDSSRRGRGPSSTQSLGARRLLGHWEREKLGMLGEAEEPRRLGEVRPGRDGAISIQLSKRDAEWNLLDSAGPEAVLLCLPRLGGPKGSSRAPAAMGPPGHRTVWLDGVGRSVVAVTEWNSSQETRERQNSWNETNCLRPLTRAQRPSSLEATRPRGSQISQALDAGAREPWTDVRN
ncbi:hypothetical protein CMUS01_05948 [Colletotrichum musicola]|uniref:Uncharacterized protein n=1 Tax=Colletotrichum musicola TaxID=2175873 RepID=A0A8H6NJP3_9PEZI|nr:hypothetical protein CMUS01_05948 [Colletotrichum musicola]